MMSKEQLDARLDHIEEQRDAMQERVEGYADQEMAKAFLESDWSQEELAAYLGERWRKEVSREWVTKRLLFGRFILFFGTTGTENDSPGAEWKLPRNLTERGFRRIWEEETKPTGNFTGKRSVSEAAVADEKRRFTEVIKWLIAHGMSRQRKQVKKAIIAELGARPSWLTADEIRERLVKRFPDDLRLEDVTKCLRTWNTNEKEPYRVEKAGEGETAQFRIVKVKGLVGRKQIAEWSHELIPMLDRLIKEAQKDRVEVSLSSLCELAGKIKKVMESMTAQVPVKEK